MINVLHICSRELYFIYLIMANIHLSRDLDEYKISESFECTVEEAGTYIDVHTRKLSVVCQNIRSIDRNLPQLEILLSRLKINTDILILTECWLNKINYMPSLNNYSTHCSQFNKSQNEGVVVFLRSDITATVSEPPPFEGNCLIIKLGLETVIVAVYRPPSYRLLDNFLKSIDEIISPLRSFKNIILTGDFNINIANSINNNAEEYLDLLAYHELLPAHTFPTRENSCLDHIFLKSQLKSTALVYYRLLHYNHYYRPLHNSFYS